MNQGIHSKNRGQCGFSLIELMVVVIVVLVITAIALPNFMRGLREYRLNNAGTEVANLIQQTRYTAVRLNRDITVRATCPGVVPVRAWVDLNNNGAFDPGGVDLDGDGVNEAQESTVVLSNDIVFGPPGAPGPGTMGAAYAAANLPACGGAANAGIRFNSRGILDFVAGAAPVFFVPVGYSTAGLSGFRAVTVTPMGKTKLWKGGSGGWTGR
ncbi:MAG: GspH/FimT family pseudopilin [Verrucomicrobia subdivision 3 bacterium]|nr:GspH/FimT family pseudopilin [Limisphaerales bacterium]